MAEIGQMFHLKKKVKNQVQADPPTPSARTPDVAEARRVQLRADAQRRGRSSTILTGGAGLQDEALVGRTTLLGG